MLKSFNKIMILMISLVGIMSLIASGAGSAQEQNPKMAGWEIGSPYNKLYKVADMDAFKATVEEIKEVVPLPGMSPVVALVVRESKTEKILVHVAPSWFINTRNIGIRKGERVHIRGAWAEINGSEVFMASKIKKGDHFYLKVRLTSDGTPFWTMSPEQLAKEIAAAAN